MKRYVMLLGVGIVSFSLVLIGAETYLTMHGFGSPPLYQYDAHAGYVLKPSQKLKRINGARVFINSLGMRCHETTREKPPGVTRVLLVGDSVPYGGSYIDQDDLFCNVAQRILNAEGIKVEILNAGVNGWGPRNIFEFVQTRGLYNSDLVIVYLPWSDLDRDFANFYIAPFWANSPGWALAECFRFLCWQAFGRLSKRWKNFSAFKNQANYERNLFALQNLKAYCDRNETPVYFLWSPQLPVINMTQPDLRIEKKTQTSSLFPAGTVVLDSLFLNESDVDSLYVDRVHYSKKGHKVVGKWLAEFLRKGFIHAELEVNRDGPLSLRQIRPHLLEDSVRPAAFQSSGILQGGSYRRAIFSLKHKEYEGSGR